MRILGLTPCFFPVCEGLEGGWDILGDCRRRRAGGDPRMWGETLEWDGGTPRMGWGTPRMGGGDPRMGGGDPRMGWGIP